MNLEEVLNYRRSTWVLDREKQLDPEKVKHRPELATLASNSSNMQLWEFYQVTQPELLTKIFKVCLDQTATSTALKIIVLVTRQDLYQSRARFVLDFKGGGVRRNSPRERQEKRIKDKELYYGKLMSFLYARFLGILGFLRVLLTKVIGLFRPTVHEVSEGDMRVVVHKSYTLAAQTFTTAMANEGYNTRPLEGFDNKQTKKLLKLPHGAEVNMVIDCGIRDGNKGIWGERGKVPLNEVYHRV